MAAMVAAARNSARPRPSSMHVNGHVGDWSSGLADAMRASSPAPSVGSNGPAPPSNNTNNTNNMGGVAAVVPGDGVMVASGNGVSLSISLAEPLLFLQGMDQAPEAGSQSTTMLRGSFHLRVAKAAKIKTISLSFKGRAVTEWPEGIPPKKTEFRDVDSIINHTWPFFNAQFQTAELGSGADIVRRFKGPSTTTTDLGLADQTPTDRRRSAFSLGAAKDQKRLSLSVDRSRTNSFPKDGVGENGVSAGSNNNGPTVAQKGFRLFQPGDYIYNFELPLDSRLPESLAVELGSVRYHLEAVVERAGAFRANLMGSREVTLIRAPTEGSLEQVEPIAISRNWEDQLHYDIVISGKSFPLGSQIPIAFKLTPLAKVQCHKIKVFVTENVQYFTSNKRVHRLEPTRKLLLFEKRADSHSVSAFPGSQVRIMAGGGVAYDARDAAARGNEDVPRDPSNLLGNLDSSGEVGPTEMEFNVQLPSCHQMKDRDHNHQLHFDTTYNGIQVHHWIKVVLRLSKPDAVDPSKRRHFEISIDSPFHILSCQAAQANIALPAYTSPESVMLLTDHPSCGCPGAPRRRSSPPVNLVPSYRYPPPPNVPSGTPNGSLPNGIARPQAAHLSNGTPPPDQTESNPSSTASSTTDIASSSSTTDLQTTAGGSSADATSAATAAARPIHLLRAPSFLPPPFSASQDDPPPPLVTPPPNYDTLVADDTNGLADYFQRLANEVSEEEDSRGTMMHGARMEVPLTPGGRVNRSMDERRTWVLS